MLEEATGLLGEGGPLNANSDGKTWFAPQGEGCQLWSNARAPSHHGDGRGARVPLRHLLAAQLLHQLARVDLDRALLLAHAICGWGKTEGGGGKRRHRTLNQPSNPARSCRAIFKQCCTPTHGKLGAHAGWWTPGCWTLTLRKMAPLSRRCCPPPRCSLSLGCPPTHQRRRCPGRRTRRSWPSHLAVPAGQAIWERQGGWEGPKQRMRVANPCTQATAAGHMLCQRQACHFSFRTRKHATAPTSTRQAQQKTGTTKGLPGTHLLCWRSVLHGAQPEELLVHGDALAGGQRDVPAERSEPWGRLEE